MLGIVREVKLVERIGIAHDIGFRVFQIALPPWGRLNDDEYLTFFKDVCGSFPDSKFIHHNLPRVRRVLLGREYRRLEDAVPNLASTRNTRTDLGDIRSIATSTSEIQHFWGEAGFAYGCALGESSLLASWGPMFPARTKELFNYGITGQFDRLLKLGVEFAEVTGSFMGPARAVAAEHIDGAYDKMIVRASGVDMPLRMLSPYQGFYLDIFEACLKGLKEQHADWLA